MKNSACNYTPKNQVSIMWNESASDAEKLNRVITQKWIANFPLGAEAWNDYRRTGYPDIFPAYDKPFDAGCDEVNADSAVPLLASTSTKPTVPMFQGRSLDDRRRPREHRPVVGEEKLISVNRKTFEIMKKAILHIALSALVAGGLFSACSDWTEPEPRNYFEPKSESYHAALRDYKKSDHQVTFGWFGNWTATGTSLRGNHDGSARQRRLQIDVGQLARLSPEKKEDLRQVEDAEGHEGAHVLHRSQCRRPDDAGRCTRQLE